MAKTFLVKFNAKVLINGQIQVEAKTQEEAEELAEMILQETLNFLEFLSLPLSFSLCLVAIA